MMSNVLEREIGFLYEDEVSRDYSSIPQKDDRIGLVRMAAREVDDGKSKVHVGEYPLEDRAYEENMKQYLDGVYGGGNYKHSESQTQGSALFTVEEPTPEKPHVEEKKPRVPKESPKQKALAESQQNSVSKEMPEIDSDRTTMLGADESNCYLRSTNTGETFYIVSNPFVIGRKQDADLCIAEKVVSGHHAEISELGGRMFLTDLNSTNGTLVNGQKIPKESMVELHNGAEIVFANKKYKFYFE